MSNRFYEIVLGPSMAYTCAVFRTPTATLEEALRPWAEAIVRSGVVRFPNPMGLPPADEVG